MSLEKSNKTIKILLGVVFGVFVLFFGAVILPRFVPTSNASIQDEIAARQQQIDAIQKQIDEYQKQIDENSGKAKTLAGAISKLNAQIGQLQLQIRSLDLSIVQTNSDITETQAGITLAQSQLDDRIQSLSGYIRILDQTDQENLTQIIFKNDRLSDFFDNLKNIEDTQNNLRVAIEDIKNLKANLEQKEDDLSDKKTQLQTLKSLQEGQKSDLDSQKSYQNKLLAQTKGEEAKYQKLVDQSKADIERIRSEITYLQANGVTAEEAVKYGVLAATRVGIRPAFLIAELEVESKLGANVGKCNRPGDPPEKSWRVVMKPERDQGPFQQITTDLGLDVDTTPVSCPQYVNGKQYGWGGAMGPAQFIPSTWMGYKDAVSDIIGRPANPWNIEDAFTAAALKLARGGATSQTRAGEVAASKAYYSGNPNCSSAPCNNYANAVQSKAAIIEQSL